MNIVQAIPKKSGNFFRNRISLLQAYRGLKGNELNNVSGLNDTEFVHVSGFIGGAWSQESAIKIAEESVKSYKKNQE